MKKKLFSTMLALLTIGAMLVSVGCKTYDDDISSLDKRVSTLESTVASLKTAIESGATISSVVKTTEGIKITLSNGQSYDVTNGKDGKAGSVVQIGADGYWYIDGVKTDYKAQGQDGKDGKDGVDGQNGKDGKDGVDGQNGKDGQDGKDGKDGQDGKDGKDGGYWQPDVAQNAWVEYNADGTPTGKTVTPLYPTGAGITAVYDSKLGTVTFANVDGAPDGIVTISSLPSLKSLAFVPDTIFDGLGVITYNTAFKFKDKKDGQFKYATSTPDTLTYRISPANANMNGAPYNMITRTVYTKANGDETGLVQIYKVTPGNGQVSVVTRISSLNAISRLTEPGHDKDNTLAALKVTTVDGWDVTSDYAYARVKAVAENYGLGHKDAKEYYAYRPGYITITDPTDSALYTTYSPVLKYDESVDLKKYVEAYSLDLHEKLYKAMGFDEDYITYSFEFAGKDNGGNIVYGLDGKKIEYLGDDNRTNQNAFVTLTADGVMAVNKDFVPALIPAINRTPLVHVTATYKGYYVADAYIKVVIVRDKPAEPTEEKLYHKIMLKHHVDFTYENLSTTPTTKDLKTTPGDSLQIVWDEVNQKVLDVLGLTFEEFQNRYNLLDGDVKKLVNLTPAATGAKYTYATPSNTPGDLGYLGAGISKFADSPTSWKTTTNVMSVTVDNTVKAPVTDTLVLVYMAKDNSKDYNVAVEFTYSVSKPVPHTHVFAIDTLKLNPDYLLGTMDMLNFTKPADTFNPAPYDVYGAVKVKGRPDNPKASAIIEHFKNYKLHLNAACGPKLTFKIVNKKDSEYKFEIPAGGAGAVTSINDTSVLTLNSLDIANIEAGIKASPDIISVQEYAFGTSADVLIEVTEECSSSNIEGPKTKTGYYYVQFKSTNINITIKNVELGTYKEKGDTVLVDSLVTVTDGLGEKLFTYDATQMMWSPTQYAKDTYGLPQETFISIDKVTLTYPKDTKESFGGCLTKEDNQVTLIIWDNKGTDLQNNKEAAITFDLKILQQVTIAPAKDPQRRASSYAEIYKTTGLTTPVIVLSTENTKKRGY